MTTLRTRRGMHGYIVSAPSFTPGTEVTRAHISWRVAHHRYAHTLSGYQRKDPAYGDLVLWGRPAQQAYALYCRGFYQPGDRVIAVGNLGRVDREFNNHIISVSQFTASVLAPDPHTPGLVLVREGPTDSASPPLSADDDLSRPPLLDLFDPHHNHPDHPDHPKETV